MSSKKLPSDKWATLLRASDYTKSFSKDWTRLSHSGRFNLKQLKEVMRAASLTAFATSQTAPQTISSGAARL
jgi:hypothetical protein